MNQASNLEQFLTSQKTGEFISEGAFQLSSQELVKKLGDSLVQPQTWILKLVQGADALHTKTLKIKLGRKWLRLEFELEDHFALTNASDFLQISPQTKAHQHLLFGLLCAVNLYTSEVVQLAWTRPEGICRLTAEGRSFEFSSMPAQSDGAPSLGFALKRRSMTTLEKLFRKASFCAEFKVLQERCRLYPNVMLTDGRPLDNWLQVGLTTHTSMVGLISGSLDTEFPLKLPPSITQKASEYPPTEEPRTTDVLMELLYTDPEYDRLPCKINWLLDGVIIQQDTIFSGDTNVSLNLYLSAEGLKTDLSTLQLVEDEQKKQRWTHLALKEWLIRSLDWAGAHCIQRLAPPAGTMTRLLAFDAKRPIDKLRLREGFRKRQQDLRKLFYL